MGTEKNPVYLQSEAVKLLERASVGKSSRAVIGGLITSTLLTLFIVPVVSTYFDGMGAWLKHRFIYKERRASTS